GESHAPGLGRRRVHSRWWKRTRAWSASQGGSLGAVGATAVAPTAPSRVTASAGLAWKRARLASVARLAWGRDEVGRGERPPQAARRRGAAQRVVEPASTSSRRPAAGNSRSSRLWRVLGTRRGAAGRHAIRPRVGAGRRLLRSARSSLGSSMSSRVVIWIVADGSCTVVLL